MEQAIKHEAPLLAQKIKEAAGKANNEAEFRSHVARFIEDFSKRVNLNLYLREEYTLIDGRADAVYSRFVIEYEAPGSLRKQKSFRHNQHAIGQVKGYIKGLHRKERHKLERIAGVVLDGNFYIFVRHRNERWFIDDPVPVTSASTERFLRYLASLSTELALTPQNLVRDFGDNKPISRLCVSTFYNALVNNTSPKVDVLFKQWQIQFSEICGYKEGSIRIDITRLRRSFGIQSSNINTLAMFFAIHTYYATFIKLLAVQVVSYYAFKFGTGLEQVASYTSDQLVSYLKKMERGGIFKDFGINNLLEGDFFGWYLDLWDEDIDRAVRRIISQLANYSLVTLDVDPEETRDLLKKLYQNLMSKELRHDLGEYYTPDWLAERLLNQLEAGYFKGNPDKRLLDTGCGSGTFLVLAIKKIKEYCNERLIPEYQVLEKILQNIVGFDLNPLAVITARTNYLLALGDLLAHRRGEIDIPVYLCDSILTPMQKEIAVANKENNQQLSMKEDVFSFKTAVGEFQIPRSLISAQYVDQLANLLEESVENQLTTSEFRRRALKVFPLMEPKDEKDLKVLEQLYDKLRDLDKTGVNGIWARIIKNAFAPLFIEEFDYIAGNPPWVNWESLPDEYRLDTKPLWFEHGLFPHKGMDTILGKGKKDISMLMTYVAMDNYLKNNGRLGFVITQSVFKTAGAGQGFRRFKLGSGTPIRVIAVDDMVEIKPFEGVGNRTSIVVFQKGKPTRYPVPYNLWRKTVKGKTVKDDMSLEEVKALTTFKKFDAEPVDEKDRTSPWLTGRRWPLKAIKKVLGKSDYQAHAGVYSGGANGVYWVNIVAKRPDGLVVVSNITEGAKRKVESVQAAIEPDLLYPLVRGRDVQRWKAEPSAYIVMVQDPEKRVGMPEERLKLEYPTIYNYLKRFEEPLRRRSAYKRYFRRDAPFYSMFNVGHYTFAPRKVVWPWISKNIRAATVSFYNDKVCLPEHNTSFVDFVDQKEADYFAACLNSNPCDFAIRSFYSGGGGGIASPKVLEKVAIPKFNPRNKIHELLSELSHKAHQLTKRTDKDLLLEIEAEIDELAAKLWGLTDAELKDIQKSLDDLG